MSPTGRRYKIVRKSDGKVIWSCALSTEGLAFINMLATEVCNAMRVAGRVSDFADDYEIQDSLGVMKTSNRTYIPYVHSEGRVG